jgi:HPr kinase/phosphorylase
VERSVTAYDLFEALQKRLDLQWISGPRQGDVPTISSADITDRPTLAGFLNLIHPNRVQVLGDAEIRYLSELDERELQSTVRRILQGHPLAIITADGLSTPAPLIDAACGHSTSLMSSAMRAHELVHFLQYHISLELARSTTLHGVFMEMFTIGVLITGGAGSGKSELALELLNRGHRLIADDAPEFTQISPEIIDGTCPEALQDCLEVRGLGVLNVRRMFGDAAIKLNKFLRLIIHLEVPDDPLHPSVPDRLKGNSDIERVLDLDIPRITLPVLAGRNMAVISEAAVRDFMLKMKGYDASSAFIERHNQILRRQQRSMED